MRDQTRDLSKLLGPTKHIILSLFDLCNYVLVFSYVLSVDVSTFLAISWDFLTLVPVNNTKHELAPKMIITRF